MAFFHRKRPWHDTLSSEITPESVYLNRREFMGASAAFLGTAALGPTASDSRRARDPEVGPVTYGEELRGELNDFEAITTYNNFYEFGYDKSDPSRHSGDFEPTPWTVRIEGAARNTGTFALEDFVNPDWVEERIYRMRCVEAWSMVIPWMGIPLRNVIARAEPTSQAKYLAFETVVRPEQMPGQRRPLLDWPYREGLRIDEAANELAFLATGLYGQDLLNQNGAPLRLVVPWKYGFKGIKSIVAIRFVEDEPYTTWRDMAPHEYGFYGNVNPEVDHPRWSQARERRIGELGRRPTLPFNGYAEQVAHLYAGMNPADLY
jgi:sulfoxide reductase catalytic subunit YedY